MKFFHLDDKLKDADVTSNIHENAEHVYLLKPKRHYGRIFGFAILTGAVVAGAIGAYRLNEYMKEKKIANDESQKIEWEDVSA